MRNSDEVYYRILIFYRREADVAEEHIVEEYQIHPGFLELEGELSDTGDDSTIYINSSLIDNFTVEEVLL